MTPGVILLQWKKGICVSVVLFFRLKYLDRVGSTEIVPNGRAFKNETFPWRALSPFVVRGFLYQLALGRRTVTGWGGYGALECWIGAYGQLARRMPQPRAVVKAWLFTRNSSNDIWVCASFASSFRPHFGGAWWRTCDSTIGIIVLRISHILLARMTIFFV